MKRFDEYEMFCNPIKCIIRELLKKALNDNVVKTSEMIQTVQNM